MKELRVGDWTVRPELNQLSRGETNVQIEPRVMNVLMFLASRPGEVLPKDTILKAVWPGTFVSDEVLTYSISELRKAFQDDARNPAIIQTIPRRGYRLIAPVAAAEPQQQASEGEAALDQGPPPAAEPSIRKGRRALASVAVAVAALAVAALAFLSFTGKIPWPWSPAGDSTVMLAVLPFENLSGDSSQEYFSDGLTEELLTRLGSLDPQRLHVIARTTAMKYKGARKGIDQIAQEIGVNYILEGSVRRERDLVRISAQLIQTKDQTHIWAQSYDREAGGILSIQNEVAEAVARSIQVTLTEREKMKLANPRPVAPEAHEAYLKGRFLWNKRSPADLQRAIEYFQEAIRRDPGYARANSGLADAEILLVEYGYAAPEAAYREAKAAALKALELDNGIEEAHASLGMLKYFFEWDWAGAERDFEVAISLNPSYTSAHHWYANLLSSLGRRDDARREIERAVQTDMLSPTVRTAMAWRVYGYAREYEKGIEQARAALELDEHYLIAYRRLGILYLLAGKNDEAIAQIRKGVPSEEPSPLALADLGHAYAVAGRRVEALAVMDQLKEFTGPRHLDASRVALIYVGLGEKGHALDWLEQGLRQRDIGMVVIRSDPRFDPLHDQPRFHAMLRAMNLPEITGRSAGTTK